MMEDQYVTFETAKLLWRNGFGDQHTDGEAIIKAIQEGEA